MPTLTVIIGYCGSGKSFWIEQKRVEFPDAYCQDEGAQLIPSGGLDPKVAEQLKKRDCFVSLMECGDPRNRAALEASVQQLVPGAVVKWIFFENDVDKANRNCRNDRQRSRAVEANVSQNNAFVPRFSIPDVSTVLPIHVLLDPDSEPAASTSAEAPASEPDRKSVV